MQSPEGLYRALAMLQSALQQLDESGAPAEIGATVDFAVNRLAAHLNPGLDAQLRNPRCGLERSDATH